MAGGILSTRPTGIGGLQGGLNPARDRAITRGFEKLTSGQRINRAADDAAGLAVAEFLRTQVRQTGAEIGNLETGLSAVQVAEGGLESQQEGIGRLRELAVQGANGTLTDDQRSAINQEAQQILEEIGNVGQNTEFNGTSLLNGANPTVNVGTESGQQLTFNESTVNSLGLNGLDLGTQEGAANAITALDNATDQLAQNRAGLGAQANGLTSAIQQRETAGVNVQEAESRIRDADIARLTIEQTRNQLLQRAELFATAQRQIVPQNAARLLGR